MERLQLDSNGSKSGFTGERDAARAETPVFRHLGRRKAYEEVAEELRRQIFERGLPSNHRLPSERDLAEKFGVSRVVVRESIRSLERAGLLTVRKGPKGGLFVAQNYDRPVADSIVNLLAGGGACLEDLFEARLLIEPYCAFRAAEIASEDDIALLATLVETDGREDAASMRKRNLEFHKHLIRLGGNPVLAVVGEAVLNILSERIRALVSPETSREALAGHQKIFRAIRDRKRSLARARVVKDISETGSRFAALSPEAKVSMAAEPTGGI